ncbi:MAG: NADH-ubiquinone oxidoreductase-F iron-sulfur binding region domain-containing protein [Dehalococcoidia bacterium]
MAEKRIVLSNCGTIDPHNIESYLKVGGFKAYEKARRMKPKAIVEEVKKSGLTGRGGAGFNCGIKWELAMNAKGHQKYLICNADEGEVGAFKDKYILSNDPYGLIEGMLIAGLAIGARQAYIYLRGEYHPLNSLLVSAIEQARTKGYLKDMDIQVFEGAGAYVCGEESALMNSIEGQRGESRYKPPYPPQRGLWNMPTIINNVETLMNIPHIISNGSAWFSAMGSGRSRGTKVFSVSGDIARPGIYEVEMGSTLKKLVVELSGATDVKAVQIGGATGNVIPGYMIDTPLSHEAFLGSGAVMVFNSTRDIIDIVYNDMHFLNEESCGKCTPCREGTEVMLEIYGRLRQGDGKERDINTLEELARTMAAASLCGLGQAAAVPVLDSLRYFYNEYIDRIDQSQFLRSYLGGELVLSKEGIR